MPHQASSLKSLIYTLGFEDPNQPGHFLWNDLESGKGLAFRRTKVSRLSC